MQYDDTEPIAKGSRLRDTITICEIQSECPFPRLDKYTVRQIGAILKSLGWEYVSKAKRIAGYKIDSGKNKLSRYYKRPESDTDNTPNIADDESDI